MQRKIRLGIIGCGKIAGSHAQVIAETDLFDIVAICDSDEEVLKSFGESLKNDGIMMTTEYIVLLENPKVEAVLISTYTDSHVQLALASLNKGKHVLLEKPFAVDSHSFINLMKVAKSSNSVLYPALEYRHSDLMQTILAWSQKTDLQNPLFIQINEFRGPFVLPWFYDQKKSGGAINDKLIHFFDIAATLFAPSLPKSVFASGSQHVLKNKASIQTVDFGEIKLKEPTIVDNASIIIEFEDNKRLSCNLIMYQKPPVSGLTINITAQNGHFVNITDADSPHAQIHTNRNDLIEVLRVSDPKDSDINGFGHIGSKKLLLDFYEKIVNIESRRNKESLNEMIIAQLMCFAAEESIKKKVIIDFQKISQGFILQNPIHEGKEYELVAQKDTAEVPVRMGILGRFLRRKNTMPEVHIALSRRRLRRIVNIFKTKYKLGDIVKSNLTLKIITPIEASYIRVTPKSIVLNVENPTLPGDVYIEISVTEAGLIAFLKGESMIRQYVQGNIKMKGDLREGRRYKQFALSLIDEIKKLSLQRRL